MKRAIATYTSLITVLRIAEKVALLCKTYLIAKFNVLAAMCSTIIQIAIACLIACFGFACHLTVFRMAYLSTLVDFSVTRCFTVVVKTNLRALLRVVA